MTRTCWSLVDTLSGMLDPDEREAVRGDLAESGETGGQALRSAENRCGSFRTRAQTILAFHLPPRMRDVKATGQGLENFIDLH